MNTEDRMSCGCVLVLALFNLAAGGWSVNYLLDFWLGETIPLVAAVLLGLIVAEVSFPIAIVVLILQLCGVI